MLRVRRQDLPLLALLGLLLYAIFPFALNAGLAGLKHRVARSCSRPFRCGPPFWRMLSARAAWATSKARLVLSLVGVAIAVASRGVDWQGDTLAFAGDGLILLATVSGAAYSVLVKRAFVRYSALTITAYGMLIGTVIMVPAALVEGLATVQLSGQTLILVCFSGYWVAR
jgi:hypothetical protein